MRKASLARRSVPARKPAEPGLLDFLANGSEIGLENARLNRLARAANCRKLLVELLDEMTDLVAEARAAEILLAYRRKGRK
jgi:hypothetical protein